MPSAMTDPRTKRATRTSTWPVVDVRASRLRVAAKDTRARTQAITRTTTAATSKGI
jgi:hypothetical protein